MKDNIPDIWKTSQGKNVRIVYYLAETPIDDYKGRYNSPLKKTKGIIDIINGNTIYLANENGCLEIISFNHIYQMVELKKEKI